MLGGGRGGARRAGARRDPRIAAPADRSRGHPLRHRVLAELAAPLRLGAAARRGRQPRRRRSRSCAACELDHPALGGENPAVLAWRSAAALSLAELGRHDEARALAADELRRARVVRRAARDRHRAARRRRSSGPAAERADGLRRALEVLEPSPARLEHARVLVDLGATLRAAGQRSAAREPAAGRPGAGVALRRPGPGAPGARRAGRDRRPAADHRPLRRRLADAERAARGRARGRRPAPTGRSPRRCSSPRRRWRRTSAARFASSTSPRADSSPTCWCARRGDGVFCLGRRPVAGGVRLDVLVAREHVGRVVLAA